MEKNFKKQFNRPFMVFIRTENGGFYLGNSNGGIEETEEESLIVSLPLYYNVACDIWEECEAPYEMTVYFRGELPRGVRMNHSIILRAGMLGDYSVEFVGKFRADMKKYLEECYLGALMSSPSPW